MTIVRTLVAAATLVAAVSLPAQIALPVNANMDIYRAGGYNDSSDGIAPAVYSFVASSGKILSFASVSGSWACSTGVPAYTADGTTGGPCFQGGQSIGTTGKFSGYNLTDFVGALAGIFLAEALPGSAPRALRFYVNDASAGGIRTNFKTLSPRIGQVFFIGDGLTGTGTGSVQQFAVPATATHLYLGYVSNCPGASVPGCYANNVGTLTVVFSVQQYIPAWVQPTLPVAPGVRADIGTAYDTAMGSVLLFGGDNARFPGAVVYGDTWVWRNGWIQLSPASSPPARGVPAMAYDPTTGTVVLFGGRDANGVALGDTWTWDGATWTQQFPPVSPPARSTGMVYDPITETVVLFGGGGNEEPGYGSTVFGDTWEWNGRTKTWTQLFPASSPSPRATVTAYDPITKTVILFGGANGGGDCCRVFYGDTWTWDGVNWTQLSPANSPSARGTQMTHDISLGQVVLFGGTSGPPQGLNDTWTWTGKTWQQLTWASQSTGVWGGTMASDPLTGGLVFFGGELTGDVVTNNTWLFVPVPVP